jgi:hypothetical protein
VECITDAHCSDVGERCSTVLGLCAVMCTADRDCPTDNFCDNFVGFCVECKTDADCTMAAKPYCRGSQCTP